MSDGSPLLPRQHHYMFAHVALKMMCFENPVRFFAIMASEDSRNFVNFIWQLVDDQCKEKTDLKPEDIQFYPMRIDNYPAVLFVMHPPIAVTEAYMIAIVLRHDLTAEISPENAEIAYYTLEYGVRLDSTPRTVLCAWDRQSHINYGDGPEADMGSFVEKIREIL